MKYVLHGYFRSTASWRVRLVLGLKALDFDTACHHLRRGEQRAPAYLALNPQGLVPSLQLEDGRVLTQSLAICEYLDAVHPEPPLLPSEPFERARVRAFAAAIACDIHPVQNLKVLARLQTHGLQSSAVDAWARSTIEEGLDACARLVESRTTPFCFGDCVSLADVCLIPQLANARRFGVDVERWSRLVAVDRSCDELPAFRAALPSRQPDAE